MLRVSSHIFSLTGCPVTLRDQSDTTISSSPTEKDHILTSTRIRDTPSKQELAGLADGTNILAWGPQGEFTLQRLTEFGRKRKTVLLWEF